MEKPFAKLFDLPDGAQVLYYLDHTDTAKLVQRTQVQGIAIIVEPEFPTSKEAREAFDEITEDQAAGFRAQVMLMLDEYTEH